MGITLRHLKFGSDKRNSVLAVEMIVFNNVLKIASGIIILYLAIFHITERGASKYKLPTDLGVCY